MRILILEDDLLTALDLQMVVEASGHDVVGMCDCLADANRKLAVAVDFAFLDIDLPDGKSFDLASRLKERRIPFAFVSASTRSELPEHLRQADFIAKPYQHAAILDTLRSGRAAM